MPVAQYHFRQAVSAYFELPTTAAKRLLPAPLEPLELRHGSAILAVAAFDFSESEVGPYGEIVLGVAVPPLLKPGRAVPRSAIFPFVIGTSTEASRRHAMERWHLPHYMKDVRLLFEETAGRIQVRAEEGRTPVLEMGISQHQWSRVLHLYQTRMRDGERWFKADFHVEGAFTEHEEETGSLALHDHPICASLSPAEIASAPFREMWMKNGVQTFEELEPL